MIDFPIGARTWTVGASSPVPGTGAVGVGLATSLLTCSRADVGDRQTAGEEEETLSMPPTACRSRRPGSRPTVSLGHYAQSASEGRDSSIAHRTSAMLAPAICQAVTIHHPRADAARVFEKLQTRVVSGNDHRPALQAEE